VVLLKKAPDIHKLNKIHNALFPARTTAEKAALEFAELI